MLTTDHSSVAVLGVPFHNVTMDETVAFINDKIQLGGFHQIATANVDFLMHAIRDPELQAILCSCELVIPDGMPILWASKMMGVTLKERVCGVDLVPRVAELCARRGYSMFLLGASEQNSARAAANLEERFPGLHIAGRYSPPVRPLDQMNHDEILQRINQARPDVLLVAMGNPKQEKWLAMHRYELNVPVAIGVGGSIDFVAGAVARAPKWMQNSGLEWAYRMSQEPKRLVQRYLGDAVGIARHLPSQLMATMMQPRHKTQSGLFTDRAGNTLILSIYGDFTGEILSEFNALSQEAMRSGLNLILNLSQTSYLGPDALGSLLTLASARREYQQLWLAEMPAHLLRVLHAARLGKQFMTTSSINDALYRTAKSEQNLFADMQRQTSNLPAPGPSRVQVRGELLQNVCQNLTVESSMQSPAVPAGFSHEYDFRPQIG
jgi:N-acetylglucosaminyldiphosphoundecaprenol N-acetyl-beta-D-mannosaminyltransferase